MNDVPADVPAPSDDPSRGVDDDDAATPTGTDTPAEPNRPDAAEPTVEPSVDRDAATAPEPEVDLGAIERDLEAVEAALDRLSEGTYWTDEVTGEPLPDELLATDPTARRVSTP